VRSLAMASRPLEVRAVAAGEHDFQIGLRARSRSRSPWPLTPPGMTRSVNSKSISSRDLQVSRAFAAGRRIRRLCSPRCSKRRLNEEADANHLRPEDGFAAAKLQ